MGYGLAVPSLWSFTEKEKEMIELSPGMRIRVEDKYTFPVQSFNTLSACMFKWDHEVTDESYAERLKQNSGMAVWLNAEATVLAAHPLPQEPAIPVRYGDEVLVSQGCEEERGVWIITAPGTMSGDSCRLVRKES